MTSTKGLGSLHQPVPDESVILFYTAIANNKVRQVHQMLEENARLVNYKNERHETALHIATRRKTDPSICELLLDYGADVNVLYIMQLYMDQLWLLRFSCTMGP